MDNLITGNLDNIQHLLANPAFSFIQHDITQFVAIEGTLDFILHFASPASPLDYLKIPIQTLKVGAIGTYNLLGLARIKQARILVASTSEVYGDPLVHPQSESYLGNVNPVGPRGVYDEAKRYLEAITTAYHTYHNVDIRIARIFNVYGPKMRLNDGRVVPTFIKQALFNQPLTVCGNGLQTRSFCYIDDVVEAIYRLLFAKYTAPINIGNPDEISIIDFANEIKSWLNPDISISFTDLPVDDPIQRQPDISLAQEILNWSPLVGRKEGIIKTYNYFKSTISVNTLA